MRVEDETMHFTVTTFRGRKWVELSEAHAMVLQANKWGKEGDKDRGEKAVDEAYERNRCGAKD